MVMGQYFLKPDIFRKNTGDEKILVFYFKKSWLICQHCSYWHLCPAFCEKTGFFHRNSVQRIAIFNHIVCIISFLTENRFAKNRKNIQVKAGAPY